MPHFSCSLLSCMLVSTLTGSKTFTCPPEQFPCLNISSKVCLTRKQICDGYNDCPNAYDESYKTCNDENGWLAHFKSNIENVQPIKLRHYCELDAYPENCTCDKVTRVRCQSKFFTRIPENVSKNTSVLNMKDNLISHIEKRDFRNMSALKRLNLGKNKIKLLKHDVFTYLINLEKLYLYTNQLKTFKAGTFQALSNLKWLDIDDNKIEKLQIDVFHNLTSLEWISLKRNKIDQIITLNKAWNRSLNVETIDLGNNQIKKLSSDMFNQFQQVRVLALENNVIEKIEESTFDFLKDLLDLDLSYNNLPNVNGRLFENNKEMTSLSLAYNPLKQLPTDVFITMTKLASLDLQGLKIDNINNRMFQPLERLKFIYFSHFSYCQYAPRVPNCKPRSDGISSIHDLLEKQAFRVWVWIMALMCLLGNLVVFMCRNIIAEQSQMQSLIIRNLCVADFFMGIYLVIIGSQDISFRGDYNKHAYNWITSVGCEITGSIAMVSSEVSLMILCYMSIERFLYITRPFSHAVTIKGAIISMVIIWLVGLVLSLLPTMLSKEILGHFYGSNGVCFPLHIYHPFSNGWQYSASIMLGLNSVALIIITSCYIAMFVSIQTTRRKAKLKAKDISIAKRFFLIVITDAMCWVPIIVVKVCAMSNMYISGGVHAGLAIFALPINSVINPILYSLTTPSFQRRFSTLYQSCITKLSSQSRNTFPMYQMSRSMSDARSDATADELSPNHKADPVSMISHDGKASTASTPKCLLLTTDK